MLPANDANRRQYSDGVFYCRLRLAIEELNVRGDKSERLQG